VRRPTHRMGDETGTGVWTGEDVKDIVWLMLYTGYRISDAAVFDMRCLDANQVYIRAKKNGGEVFAYVPDWLRERLVKRARYWGQRPFIIGHSQSLGFYPEWDSNPPWPLCVNKLRESRYQGCHNTTKAVAHCTPLHGTAERPARRSGTSRLNTRFRGKHLGSRPQASRHSLRGAKDETLVLHGIRDACAQAHRHSA
jgi:hypothetical protein